jgi:uncharacterized Zn finger protein (UPF0148 family)
VNFNQLWKLVELRITATATATDGDAILTEICDVCGSPNVKEIKCKLICQNCGTILKSCSDL